MQGGKAAYPKGFLQLFQPTEPFSLQSEPAAWPPQPLRAARFGAKQPPTMGDAQGLEVKEGGMGSLRASRCLCRAFRSLAQGIWDPRGMQDNRRQVGGTSRAPEGSGGCRACGAFPQALPSPIFSNMSKKKP